MNLKKEVLPKGVYKLIVTIPATEVSHLREHVVEEMSKNANMAGFRPGHAPKEIVADKLDDNKVNGEVINHLIPEIFAEIQKTETLEIVTQPKIQVRKFEKDADVEIEVTLVTKPQVDISDWRKNITGITKREDVFDKLLEVSRVEIADLLLEEERSRMLARLLTQIEQLGITLEAYLASQNKTAEQLKNEYLAQAEKSLKLHFTLDQLVGDEKIEVTGEEIAAAIAAAPDEKAREAMAKPDQKWYISSILARNKVLDLVYGQLKEPTVET